MPCSNEIVCVPIPSCDNARRRQLVFVATLAGIICNADIVYTAALHFETGLAPDYSQDMGIAIALGLFCGSLYVAHLVSGCMTVPDNVDNGQSLPMSCGGFAFGLAHLLVYLGYYLDSKGTKKPDYCQYTAKPSNTTSTSFSTLARGSDPCQDIHFNPTACIIAGLCFMCIQIVLVLFAAHQAYYECRSRGAVYSRV